MCSDRFIRDFDPRFKRNSSDTCLYTLFDETDNLIVIILVYVDDYIFAHNNQEYYDRFCHEFNKKYEMTKLGKLSNYLQINVSWTDEGVMLSQTQYIDQLAEIYCLDSCNPKLIPMQPRLNLKPSVIDSTTVPYRNLLMSLMWVARNTRPDILYAVIYLSQFSNAYSDPHYTALRVILKYLIGSKSRCLMFKKPDFDDIIKLNTYSDSDWAGDQNDRKSYSGSMIYVDNSLVSWGCTKQKTVSTSSCEAEYMAASTAAKEVLGVINILKTFTNIELPTTMHIDNIGATYLSENEIHNKRSKHIDIRYHHVRDLVAQKILSIAYINTKDNVADIQTKALPKPAFQEHCSKFLSP
jgi:hypothetical protein